VELGLELHRPPVVCPPRASFKRLKRAMGAPIGALGATYTDWMYGHRRGSEVIVRVLRAQHGVETSTAVRIDPPLFLGLRLLVREQADAMMGVSGHGVGYPPIDAAFRVESHSLSRTAEFLRPRRLDGHDLAQQIVLLAPRGLFVCDTNVELVRRGVVYGVQELTDDIDAALDIAHRLALRRTEIGPTPRERGQAAEWQAFATAHDLTFDAVRMDLNGALGGARVRVCLDSDRGEIDTLVSVGFDVSLGVALRVGHQKIGPRLVASGQPEEAVQQILSRASPALVELAKRARELELTERELFVRIPGSTPTAADLGRLVTDACQLGVVLRGGETPKPGPYR
jgi:hypothetical protein